MSTSRAERYRPKCLAGSHARRAASYRNGVFWRVDIPRNGSKAEATARHGKNPNSFSTHQTTKNAKPRSEAIMNPELHQHERHSLDSVFLYALQILPLSE